MEVNGVACGCKTAHDMPATRERGWDTQEGLLFLLVELSSCQHPHSSKSVVSPGFHHLGAWPQPTVK